MDDPLNWSPDDQERALAAIARWYELDFGPLREDVEMILELIPAGERVLELGAGSGRLALPLAEAGCQVTALDSSPAMLRLGKERMRAAGAEPVCADLRCLAADALGGSFDWVLIGLSTFQHLLRRADQLSALHSARRQLAPDGRLLIDWTAPRPDDLDPAPRPMQLEWLRQSPCGEWVTKHAGQELALDRVGGSPLDRAAPIAWLTYQYDAVAADGLVHRTLARFPLRVNLNAGEMAGLLAEAGLAAVDWFGSWEFDEPGDGDRLIVIAEAAQAEAAA